MSGADSSQPASVGVIVACRRMDGRWLLVRRAEGLSRGPGMVGFPGGSVEPGETQAQAVVREMQEELAADVAPVRSFWSSVDHVPGFALFGWLAELRTPIDQLVPSPDEVAQILWLTGEEAIAHPRSFEDIAGFIAAARAALDFDA
mgnify:CR=1 FL=1